MSLTSIYFVRKLNNPTDSTINAIIERITYYALDNGIDVLPDTSSANPSTLFVGVGGDGTMLAAMRLAVTHDSYCVGINAGRVGFLTDLATSSTSGDIDVARRIVDICKHPHAYQDFRIALKCDGQIACNDITITCRSPHAMISYALSVDYISAGIHRANGVVISTPSGSTAYGMSVGGALIHPTTRAIQIAPIAPVGLTSRPIIVPASSLIQVDVIAGDAVAHADGNIVHRSDTTSSIFKISEFSRCVRLAHSPDWTFFSALTAKLGWNTHG